MNVKIADRIKAAVTIVATLILLFVLYVSREHTTHIGYWLGLVDWQAETLFVLIDLPAVIGRALTLPVFAHSTRRWGKKLTIISGALSLTCNVAAGFDLPTVPGAAGPAVYGAFVVGMFVIMEHTISKIKSAAAVTRAKNAGKAKTVKPIPATLTARQIGARKGAATRVANKARQMASQSN